MNRTSMCEWRTCDCVRVRAFQLWLGNTHKTREDGTVKRSRSHFVFSFAHPQSVLLWTGTDFYFFDKTWWNKTERTESPNRPMVLLPCMFRQTKPRSNKSLFSSHHDPLFIKFLQMSSSLKSSSRRKIKHYIDLMLTLSSSWRQRRWWRWWLRLMCVVWTHEFQVWVCEKWMSHWAGGIVHRMPVVNGRL